MHNVETDVHFYFPFVSQRDKRNIKKLSTSLDVNPVLRGVSISYVFALAPTLIRNFAIFDHIREKRNGEMIQ